MLQIYNKKYVCGPVQVFSKLEQQCHLFSNKYKQKIHRLPFLQPLRLSGSGSLQQQQSQQTDCKKKKNCCCCSLLLLLLLAHCRVTVDQQQLLLLQYRYVVEVQQLLYRRRASTSYRRLGHYKHERATSKEHTYCHRPCRVARAQKDTEEMSRNHRKVELHHSAGTLLYLLYR